jgi:hypothetical protein
MPRPITLLLMTLAFCPRLALAEDKPEDLPPPQFTTEVKGTVPDLTGRWLVVANVSPSQQAGQGGPGRTVPLALIWEVTAPDGKPNLVMRWGGLPPSLKESLDAATERHEVWEPSLAQLQELRDAWATLTFDKPPVAAVATTISHPDTLDDAIKNDPRVKDALFVVQTVADYHPGGQRPLKDVMILGARERMADGYSGSYTYATVAAAPFPITISHTGTGRMYQLESVPQRGLLERVLGVFRGCGRRSSS